MKNSLKIAVKYFKYVAVLFLISYSTYIVIDDYVFIKNISSFSDLGECLAAESMWLLAYFLGFSFYYWVAAFIIVFVYHKLFTSIKKQRISK
jgi:hypothetical protein